MEYFKAKSLIASFHFDLFYLLQKDRLLWTDHVIRRLVLLRSESEDSFAVYLVLYQV